MIQSDVFVTGSQDWGVDAGIRPLTATSKYKLHVICVLLPVFSIPATTVFVFVSLLPGTLQEFAEKAFNHVGLDWEDYILTSDKYARPNEVHHLLGDPSKANNELGWKPKTSFNDLVKKMVESDLELANREKVLIENGLINPTWEYSV